MGDGKPKLPLKPVPERGGEHARVFHKQHLLARMAQKCRPSLRIWIHSHVVQYPDDVPV
jgi:hypothetical protein